MSLAKFIIVDADKARDDLGERKNLKLLIDYCSLQNRKGTIPHFLILDSPDFEYIASQINQYGACYHAGAFLFARMHIHVTYAIT